MGARTAPAARDARSNIRRGRNNRGTKELNRDFLRPIKFEDNRPLCNDCNGGGTQTCIACSGRTSETCATCSRKGRADCRSCQGTGRVLYHWQKD